MVIIDKNTEVDIHPYGKGKVTRIEKAYELYYIHLNLEENVEDPIRVDFGDEIDIKTEDKLVEGAKVIDIEDVFSPSHSWIEAKID